MSISTFYMTGQFLLFSYPSFDIISNFSATTVSQYFLFITLLFKCTLKTDWFPCYRYRYRSAQILKNIVKNFLYTIFKLFTHITMEG